MGVRHARVCERASVRACVCVRARVYVHARVRACMRVRARKHRCICVPHAPRLSGVKEMIGACSYNPRRNKIVVDVFFGRDDVDEQHPRATQSGSKIHMVRKGKRKHDQ